MLSYNLTLNIENLKKMKFYIMKFFFFLFNYLKVFLSHNILKMTTLKIYLKGLKFWTKFFQIIITALIYQF